MCSFTALKVCIIVFFVLFFSVFMVVEASGSTAISINPVSQTISPGGSVTVTVDCIPGQPVKAFELKLSFNPSILQATSVSEGNLFVGYATFFNPGTIDNTAGTIVNIYDLIVGPGNVTNAGTFISVNFAAKSTSGSTTFALYDLGVTNEADYIQVNVTTASVIVEGLSTESRNPPFSGPPYIPPSLQNTPPYPPMKPSGPTLVELGVTYVYRSSAIDPDGDYVRLRFDWGDGSFSNWTDFVSSNTQVPVSHTWDAVSTYTVHVMAQDENNSNSNWSDPLTVIVSQGTSGGNPPVAEFFIPTNISANQTVIFNASGSYDPGGVIVSYQWDFGDGVNGTGKTPVHIYHFAGRYTVTLIVTDNSGMSYSKTQLVIVSVMTVESPSGKNALLPFSYRVLACAVIIGLFLGCIIIFRNRIKTFLIERSIDTSQRKIARFNGEMTGLDQVLDSLFLDMEKKTKEPNADYILSTYCDIIINKIEKKVDFFLPDLSIEEVEKLIDDRIHAMIVAKIDKL
jgi:chitodextrinase